MGYCNSIIGILIIFVIYDRISASPVKNGDSDQQEPVCDSDFCKRIAGNIMDSMLPSEDPCNNFYDYACGKWEKNSDNSQFSMIFNETSYRLKDILDSPVSPEDSTSLAKAKLFFKSCMDTETIEKNGLSSLAKLMSQYGGWPMAMTPFEWQFRQKPWQDVDSAFRKFTGSSPFFSINIMPDLRNSTSQIVSLSPSELYSTDYIFTSTPSAITFDDLLLLPPVVQYVNTMKNISMLIAKHQGFPVSEETLHEDSKNVVNFEFQLKGLSVPTNLTKHSNVNDMWTKLSIRHFQRAYNLMFQNTTNSKINWLEQIREFVNDVPYLHIQDSDIISIVPVDYFLRLSDLLDRTSSRVIVNTLHWWLVKNLGSYTNAEIVSLLDNMIPSSVKAEKTLPRWKKCVAQNDMKDAISYAYVKKYFSPKTKQTAIDMVHEVMNGMDLEITNSIWLDDHSKQGALKKLQLMKEYVGFPDWYSTNAAVDNFYKDVDIGELYLENVLTMQKFKRIQSLKSFRDPVNRNKWIASATTINAFYFHPGNSLTIPAGILQAPFFDAEQPDAVNYGGLGTVIGHEVSHGFDNIGSQFDHDGNVRDWWTNTTKLEYYKRARCFVDKFRRFVVTHRNTTHRLNAIKTLSENIADTTGVHAVYEAFQSHKKKVLNANARLVGLEHLSSNQLFFLSYAHTFCGNPKIDRLIHQMQSDPHSPAAFRILGTLSNMEGFAEAFHCANNTVMKSMTKCSIWGN